MLAQPISVRTLLNCALLLAVGAALSASAADAPQGPAPLPVDGGGRWLVDGDGRPVFLLADTAWDLAERVKRDEVVMYLEKRRAQGFNAITFVSFHPTVGKNVYGAAPFHQVNGRMDPTQPVVTPGADLGQPGAYDYWDHVDFVITEAARQGLYVILLPCWGGSAVTGSYSGKPTRQAIFNQDNAWHYGRWIGARYGKRSHLIWMIGGDCAGAYAQYDYRDVFRAMAEGVADGVNGGARDGRADTRGLLLSFHPQKPNPRSSAWFHGDRWLSFNSIQAWPDDQIQAVSGDWALTPPKPTWIFEGRYEAYYKGNYKSEQWGEWQCRQQAWQTVLAGAFGHTYGHERIFCFGADGWPWKKELNAPGARCMGYLAKFMNSLRPERAQGRVPDQTLVEQDMGTAGRLESDRITAMRTEDGRLALIYSANGRAIRVRMDRLAHGPLKGYWFDPRRGTWRVGTTDSTALLAFAEGLVGGPGATGREFDPPGAPGAANDWVLVLSAGEGL